MRSAINVQGSVVALAVQAFVLFLAPSGSADAQQPRPECVPSQAQSAPSEDAIAAAVERALSNEALASLNGVQVTADGAVVTLTGQVRSLLAKERATHVAEAVKGVLVIDNQLIVSPRDVKSPEILERAVSQALRNDAVLEAVEVGVHADRAGRVRVTGIVDSWAEREMIERAVKSVAGVTEVTNNVSIDASPTQPDAELAAEVERMLQWDAFLSDASIEAQARDGTVTLSGTVASAAEKSRAKVLAAMAGSRRVVVDPLRSWAQVRAVAADGLESDTRCAQGVAAMTSRSLIGSLFACALWLPHMR